ncbi:MAG: M28 family peptidase, partial [Gemmatimonadetes bacterium]|nr:M28 family peptidase [Gemmatimonadota bacterium]MYJ69006.1 M28 family peptidase [Gemmatimonadota bacterium]
PQDPTLTGFTAQRAATQLACEARFLELPRSDTFREHLRTITENPHPAGSAAQARVGRYIAGAMDRAGLDVTNYPYDVYLPELTDDVEVHIVTPVAMQLSNREPALPEDRFSGHPGLLNGWNAFSGSGDVTGEVVYANYGRREDYRALDSMGVAVAGKVVIARYGGNFRGYKVKFAEERGAAGVIMFNDPGFSGLDAYPEGPMMSGLTIQRGSVLTLPWTGDPLTPFVPALPLDGDIQVERLDPAEVPLHTIPVLPIGYEAATEILTRMAGPGTPPGWAAGMELDYRLTGGPGLTVRVRVNQPRKLTRATNVVGTLRGSEFPDEWFILGAHYDPWAFGAIDPNGGTAMLLTLAEALGELVRGNTECRPRRSIMIAHWDAEEYGIIGSTEWVEQLREELEANAIAYINADAAVSGENFGSSSSPSLKGQIIEATKAVTYPGTGERLYDWWLARAPDGAEEPGLGNLGGGSDHVGFYTHAGVPSGALSSGNPGGVYHSNYDNFAWYERFGDSEFIYGPMIARADGILALRFANADILPYDVVRYATDTRTHVETLYRIAEERDLTVDFSQLLASTTELDEAAAALVAARDGWIESGDIDRTRAEAVNRALIGLEKAWLNDRGLQGRPWSRSIYVSPDPFSGYASWMLPGLRYELETDDRADLPGWERVYIGAVGELAKRMREVATLMNR